MKTYLCKDRNRIRERTFTEAQWEAHKRRYRERYRNMTPEQKQAYIDRVDVSRKSRGR